MEAFLRAFWEKWKNKRWFLPDKVKIREKNPPQKLAPLLDLEFDIEYDFIIKHDPI